MPFLKRTENDASQAAQLEKKASPTPGNGELPAPTQRITFLAIFLGLVASIGGFMFGYVSGQISGFFAMRDYASRFGAAQADGSYTFSPAVQGSIVSFLCLGALFGSLAAGKLADAIGRRMTISTSAFSCCIGTIIEISSSDHWVQFAIGRLITGVGIGALSVTVPMYQSESTPAIIRGVVVA
ncbi:hexose transporter hxt5, partial [Oleoguttula sp. CCFEE 5521]